MKFDYLTLESLFYDAFNCLIAQGDGEDYLVSFADMVKDSQKEFVKAFEDLNKYCHEVKCVSPDSAITSQAGDVAMLFYTVKSPRMFMIGLTVKLEYLYYEQTFATCCKYFGAEDVLAVFNAYFDYLETKRE